MHVPRVRTFARRRKAAGAGDGGCDVASHESCIRLKLTKQTLDVPLKQGPFYRKESEGVGRGTL